MLEEYKGKKIALLGLGMEGIATGELFVSQGIPFTVLDVKGKDELSRVYPEAIASFEKHHVSFLCGSDYLDHLEEFDIVVRTPGISILNPKIIAAQKKGVNITSHTNLFFELCPCPIIGVTGTKGKGTTSSLIYHMLKQSGKDVYFGGNIGTAPLRFLSKLTPQSLVVLELSSFQLQDMRKSPHIAVLLMVTSDHLDYHATIEEYVDAKRHILQFQQPEDFAVINRDYLASNESDIYTEGKVYFVSRERETKGGCFIKDGAVYLDEHGQGEKIVSTKDIALLGKHNWENVCAAVMAATLAGATKEAIVGVLKSFTGLEHRLEFVAEVNGAKYYDDSYSTTPETAIAAIESFDQPEILILGGASKNSDFTELGQVISHAKNIKAIIGIGEEWPRIKERFTIHDSRFTIIENCRNMKEIILEASEIAEPGDVVLLSPACASFGMFNNYKERGEQFKKEVKELEARSKN